MKALSDTRWSSRHDSVKSVLHNYSALLKSLEEISESCEVKSDVRAAANVVSKYLPKSEIDLNQAGVLVHELIKKVEEYRSDEAFDFFLKLQVLCALKVR